VPILFHWTGEELVLASWPDDPKVAALREQPEVAITIDTAEVPFRALSIRGTAEVTIVNGLPRETRLAFARCFGPAEGYIRVMQMELMADQMARIAVRPEWVGVLDFETRFPRGTARRFARFTT
jgi:hypothetical protein